MNTALRSLTRRPRGTILTVVGGAAAACTSMLLVGWAQAFLLINSTWVGSLQTAGFLPPHLSARVTLEGVAVSFLGGLLGVTPPLLRAIRVRPADALRGV